AALLLAHLGHRPAAGRLVELLGSPRGEVFAAAGYGLRVLAVPDTLPAVTEHVGRRHQAILAGGPSAGLPGVHRDFLDRELSELVQLLGRADHRPAIPTLRRLVARLLRPGAPPSTTPLGTPVRVAAVWALGRMHAGDPDPEVTAQIEERLTGDLQVGFDDPTIRRAAAVALGRMKATGSLEVLRLYADGGGPTPDPVAHACRWAVAHMEGKPLAPPETAVEVQKDAFLLPVK
ncbi:MAG: HEAT repeat domain-containing protein, partial [Gemmataceae bacterium]|nr:HEAT repeat domain-containing protein [Gemmataceae bacterium]